MPEDQEVGVERSEAGPLAVETDERSARADWRSSMIGSIGVIVLFGLWLLASPAAIHYERPANPIIWGVVIVFIALIRMFGPTSSRTLALTNAAAGGLTVISAFAVSESSGPTANVALMGLAVVVLSLVGLAATVEAPMRSRP